MQALPQVSAQTARLTRIQRGILQQLQCEWSAGRIVESLEHLCRLLGLRSRGALHRHIQALVSAGAVAPLDRHRRGLWPVQAAISPPGTQRAADPPPVGPALPGRHRDHPLGRQVSHDEAPASRRDAPSSRSSLAGWPPGVPVRALPRLGRIAAGAPLDAVFEDEAVLVPERLAPRGDAYVLEVRGDSMCGDGILDGDLVVVDVDSHVRAGEIAVVLIAGEGATLKRFRHEGGLVRLQASNPDVPDQLVRADQVAIQGRVSGLMRHYGH